MPDDRPLRWRIAHYWLGYALWSIGTGSMLSATFYEMMGHYQFGIGGRAAAWPAGIAIAGLLGLLIFPLAGSVVHWALRPGAQSSFSRLSLHLGLASVPLTVLGGVFTALVHFDYLRLSSADIVVIVFAPILSYPLHLWAMARASPMPSDADDASRRWAFLVAGIFATALFGWMLLWYSSFLTDGALVFGRWLWLSMAGLAILYVAASASFYFIATISRRWSPLAVASGWLLGAGTLSIAPPALILLGLIVVDQFSYIE